MPKMTTPAYPATLDKIPLDLARDMRRAVSEQALAMQAAAIAFASQLHHAAAVMQEAAADLQFITASAASESETPREAIQRRAIARDLTACTWRDLADLLDIAAREARAIQHGGIDPAGLSEMVDAFAIMQTTARAAQDNARRIMRECGRPGTDASNASSASSAGR